MFDPLVIISSSIFGIFVALGIAAKISEVRKKSSDDTPDQKALLTTANIYKAKHVLTPTEQRFYHALRSAFGDMHVILMKVRLADLIAVQRNQTNYQTHFNRISAKHVDFVICDPSTLRELHDY